MAAMSNLSGSGLNRDELSISDADLGIVVLALALLLETTKHRAKGTRTEPSRLDSLVILPDASLQDAEISVSRGLYAS